MNIETLVTAANPVPDEAVPGPTSSEARLIYGQLMTQHRPTRRRPLVVGGLSVAGLAVAAAVATLVVATVIPGSPGGRPEPAAAAVLTRAVTAAASQAPLPALGPGQYYYQADVEEQLCSIPLDGTTFANYLAADTHQMWVAADGTSSLRIRTGPGGRWLTPNDEAKWQAAGSPPNECDPGVPGLEPVGSDAAVLALPSDPSVLGSLIAQGRVNDVGQVAPSATACPSQAGDAAKVVPPGDVCAVSAQFDIVTNLLSSPVAAHKLGAVLYQILSKLPGVELLGPRTDALGRSGTAVEDPSSGDVVVLDPSTGRLLETQSLATAGNSSTVGVAPGTVLGSMTFGAVSVVNGLGAEPDVMAHSVRS